MYGYQSNFYFVEYDPKRNGEELLDKNYAYNYLIYLNEEIVGIVRFIVIEHEVPNSIEVSLIYLIPEYRNKGYSKTIFNLGVKDIKKDNRNKKLNKLTLGLFYNNDQAFKAYSKMGFKPMSIFMIKDI